MKLQPDRFDTQSIAAYGLGWFDVILLREEGPLRQRMEHALLLGSGGLLQKWRPQKFTDFQPSDFSALTKYAKEIVIIGSGQFHRFVAPALLAPLYAKKIGVETMDTAAACRTYNILAQEGRHVIAALLPQT